MDSSFGALKAKLALVKTTSSDFIGTISIDGEELSIPHRIYDLESRSSGVDVLTEVHPAVVDCINTRHCDGYVREREVMKIIDVSEPWVVPFVIQLAGEYVVQIIQTMHANVEKIPSDAYRQFASENPNYIELTKSRAISYWNCYYRGDYIQFRNYPGFQFLNALGLWEPRRIPRVVTR